MESGGIHAQCGGGGEGESGLRLMDKSPFHIVRSRSNSRDGVARRLRRFTFQNLKSVGLRRIVRPVKRRKRRAPPSWLAHALTPIECRGFSLLSQDIRKWFSILLVLLSALMFAQAAEKLSLPPDNPGFKAGPGSEIAMVQCVLCHSADYVSTQPRLPRAAWKTNVLKMRDKYGAPLPDDKVEALVDYLVKTYGADAPK